MNDEYLFILISKLPLLFLEGYRRVLIEFLSRELSNHLNVLMVGALALWISLQKEIFEV